MRDRNHSTKDLKLGYINPPPALTLTKLFLCWGVSDGELTFAFRSRFLTKDELRNSRSLLFSSCSLASSSSLCSKVSWSWKITEWWREELDCIRRFETHQSVTEEKISAFILKIYTNTSCCVAREQTGGASGGAPSGQQLPEQTAKAQEEHLGQQQARCSAADGAAQDHGIRRGHASKVWRFIADFSSHQKRHKRK